jgi:hypothetical protein
VNGPANDDEDEALTWAGARDPSHYETPDSKLTKPAKGSTAKSLKPSVAVIDGSDATGVADDVDDERPPMSAVMLVCLGVLGGIYALYTVGWFVSWQRLVYVDTDALELTAFRVQQVLAIVAAPLWFGVTLFFTRERRPAIRLIWLVIGALVLIPWSFALGR